jgi:hypothetical protein
MRPARSGSWCVPFVAPKVPWPGMALVRRESRLRLLRWRQDQRGRRIIGRIQRELYGAAWLTLAGICVGSTSPRAFGDCWRGPAIAARGPFLHLDLWCRDRLRRALGCTHLRGAVPTTFSSI